MLQIRDSIKALFPNRTCFPLVRPMSDESQLQRLEAVAPSQLRPEFQQVRARSRASKQAPHKLGALDALMRDSYQPFLCFMPASG